MPLDVNRIAAYLTAEGYRPTVDGDRWVTFKHQGGFYYVEVDPSDNEYVRVVYAKFWKLADPAEVTRALAAASHATATTKVAKVEVHDDRAWVSATAELFVQSPEQLEAVFQRLLYTIQSAVARFVQTMHAPVAEEPVPGPVLSRLREWPKPN